MHQQTDFALGTVFENEPLWLAQMLSGLQFRNLETLRDPMRRLTWVAQPEHAHDKIDWAERTGIAAETLNRVVDNADPRGRRSIAVLVKFGPPAVNVTVTANDKIKGPSDFFNWNSAVDKP